MEIWIPIPKVEVIGWRDGKYIYCDSHGSDQVIDPQIARTSDPDYYEGRKCDWCRSVLKKGGAK